MPKDTSNYDANILISPHNHSQFSAKLLCGLLPAEQFFGSLWDDNNFKRVNRFGRLVVFKWRFSETLPHLLFFATYFYICKKNYTFKRVVFLFSIQFCQFFSFKNKSQQWVRTKAPQAVGSGSNLSHIRYFYDFTDICQNLGLYPRHSG